MSTDVGVIALCVTVVLLLICYTSTPYYVM